VVSVHVRDVARSGRATASEPFVMQLPNDRFPQLVEVTVSRAEQSKRARRPPAAVVLLRGGT